MEEKKDIEKCNDGEEEGHNSFDDAVSFVEILLRNIHSRMRLNMCICVLFEMLKTVDANEKQNLRLRAVCHVIYLQSMLLHAVKTLIYGRGTLCCLSQHHYLGKQLRQVGKG